MVSAPAPSLRRRSTPARVLRVAARSAVALGVLVLSGAAPLHRPGPLPRSTIEVVVIGDSLSTGAKTPGDAWTDEALPMLTRSGHHVQIVNAAENGAGYVARGIFGDTFGTEVEHAVSAETRIVVVFGSDNDLGQAPVDEAVAQTLSRVRSLAPAAQVIVVGPPAPPAQSREQLQPLSETLRAMAAAHGDAFVDALALRWFQAADAVYVGDDGEHPDRDGETYLAGRMASILRPIIDRLPV